MTTFKKNTQLFTFVCILFTTFGTAVTKSTARIMNLKMIHWPSVTKKPSLNRIQRANLIKP